MRILCDTLVQVENVRYGKYKSQDYKDSKALYIKLYGQQAADDIAYTENVLRTEKSMEQLISKLGYHKTNSYTCVYDGIRHSNPFDVHVPGSWTKNDVVILFTYDHDSKNVWLLDIGSHDKLFRKNKKSRKKIRRIQSSCDVDNELIWI